MKVLGVLLLSAVALSHRPGSFQVGAPDFHTMMQWNKLKSLEKCWGEDNMRNYMVEIKKALARCQQTDAPELELPIFRSPFKFVSSLIAGANEREQQLFNIVSRMAKQQQGSNFYPAPPDTLHNQYNPNHRVPSQYNPNYQVPSQYNPNLQVPSQKYVKFSQIHITQLSKEGYKTHM